MIGRDYSKVGDTRYSISKIGTGDNKPISGPVKISWIDNSTMAVVDARRIFHLVLINGYMQNTISQKLPETKKKTKSHIDSYDDYESEDDNDDDADNDIRSTSERRYTAADILATAVCTVTGAKLPSLAVADKRNIVHMFDIDNAGIIGSLRPKSDPGLSVVDFNGVSGIDCFIHDGIRCFVICEGYYDRLRVIREDGLVEGTVHVSGTFRGNLHDPVDVAVYLPPEYRDYSGSDRFEPKWYLGILSVEKLKQRLMEGRVYAGKFLMGKRTSTEEYYDVVYINDRNSLIQLAVSVLRPDEGGGYQLVTPPPQFMPIGRGYTSIWELVKDQKSFRFKADTRPYALIAVAEKSNRRVQVFRYRWIRSHLFESEFEVAYIIGGEHHECNMRLKNPASISFSLTGELAIADSTQKKVMILSPYMTLIKEFSMSFPYQPDSRLSTRSGLGLSSAGGSRPSSRSLFASSSAAAFAAATASSEHKTSSNSFPNKYSNNYPNTEAPKSALSQPVSFGSLGKMLSIDSLDDASSVGSQSAFDIRASLDATSLIGSISGASGAFGKSVSFAAAGGGGAGAGGGGANLSNIDLRASIASVSSNGSESFHTFSARSGTATLVSSAIGGGSSISSGMSFTGIYDLNPANSSDRGNNAFGMPFSSSGATATTRAMMAPGTAPAALSSMRSALAELKGGPEQITDDDKPVCVAFAPDGKLAIGYSRGGVIVCPSCKRQPVGVLDMFPDTILLRIIRYCSYSEVQTLRNCCRYLHDYTRAMRLRWDLFPLRQYLGDCCYAAFARWSRLEHDASAYLGFKLLPEFVDEKGKTACMRHLQQQCTDGPARCARSHKMLSFDPELYLTSHLLMEKKAFPLAVAQVWGPKFLWQYELYIDELFNAYCHDLWLDYRKDPMSLKKEVRREIVQKNCKVVTFSGFMSIMTALEEEATGCHGIHEHPLFKTSSRSRYKPSRAYSYDEIDKRLFVDPLEQYGGGINVPFLPNRTRHFLNRPTVEKQVPFIHSEVAGGFLDRSLHMQAFKQQSEKAADLISSLFK